MFAVVKKMLHSELKSQLFRMAHFFLNSLRMFL
jgi:hypothetical protein